MRAEVQSDLEQAFKELLDTKGETVTLLNGSTEVAEVDVVINRGLDAQALDAGQIDFSERNMTHVEVLRSALDVVPKVGWHFLDDDGFMHRIQTVRRTTLTYRCECEATEQESD